jgi:DNA-binding NarL/FixJ family response regulator
MTPARDRVRVLVVDDSPKARAAIGEAVAHVSDFELVGSVASGEEALTVLPQVEPDLVLLDFRMTGLDGLETSRLIRTNGHHAVVVLVTAYGRSELPDYADSCGVAEILSKSEVSPRRLSSLWRSVRLSYEHEAAADPA